MSKRGVNILVGALSLLIGGVIYILSREDSFIAAMAERFLPLTPIRDLVQHSAWTFAKYYLPDFLWGLSLGCGLHVIHMPKKTGTLLCASGAFMCGLVWEVLQYLDITGGTGDLWDIFMYLLAALLTIFINFKERVS